MNHVLSARTWLVLGAIVAMLVSMLGYAGAANAQGDELAVTKFKAKYANYFAVVEDGTPVGSPLGNTHVINGGAFREVDFGMGGAFIENFDCEPGQDVFAPPGSPDGCTQVGVLNIDGPNVRLRVANGLGVARIKGVAEVLEDFGDVVGDTMAIDLTLTPVGDPTKVRVKETRTQGNFVDITVVRGTEREAMVSGTIGDIEISNAEGGFGVEQVTLKTNRPDEGPPPGEQRLSGLDYTGYSLADLLN